MDHFFVGGSMRHYRSPQAVPIDEEVLLFADGLRDCILEKISELNDLAMILEDSRRLRLVAVKKLRNIDPFTRWFLLFWIEADFSEYQIIQRWLRYWLRLSEIVGTTEPTARTQFESRGVTEKQIARAKEFSLKELYQGELRESGGRLMGLCPFHEEKTPSFVIFEDQNRFHCFGCGADGDSVDFVQKSKECGMVEAVKSLIGNVM